MGNVGPRPSHSCTMSHETVSGSSAAEPCPQVSGWASVSQCPAPSTHLVPNGCSVAVLFLLPTRSQSDVHQITWLGVGFYIHVHWGRWGGSPMSLFLGVINCTRRRSRWISLVHISGCQSLRSTVNLHRGAWSHRVLDKETPYKVST